MNPRIWRKSEADRTGTLKVYIALNTILYFNIELSMFLKNALNNRKGSDGSK